MTETIHTLKAPQAIGSYSQAIKAGNTVYLSGQIPLHPITGELVSDAIEPQVKQVFDNIQAIAESAGGTMDSIVKITVYLTHLPDVVHVNQIMTQYFKRFPARTTIQVSALPKGSQVEIEAIMVLS